MRRACNASLRDFAPMKTAAEMSQGDRPSHAHQHTQPPCVAVVRLDVFDYQSMPRADPGRRRGSARSVEIGPGPLQSMRPVSLVGRHRRNVIRSFVGGHRPGRRCELSPACRRQLRSVLRHAGGDAIDTWDLGTAETKGVAHAGLLLLGRVSPGAHGYDRCRPQRRHHPNRTPIPGTRNGHRLTFLPRTTLLTNSG